AKFSLWDLKVVVSGGLSLEWRRLTIARPLILSYQNAQFYAGESPPNRIIERITLRNNTPFRINGVYLSPAGAAGEWREVFADGLSQMELAQISFFIREPVMYWDLRIVFSN